MNHRGSPPPGAYGRFLVAVDRRLRLGRSLRAASWALSVPVVAALVLLLFGFGLPAAFVAAATAVASLGAALLAVGRRDLARAAGVADRAADLHDLLKANLDIRERHSETPWLPLLERRAEAAVAALQPSEVVTVAPPRSALALGASALLALALLTWLSASPRGAFFSARGVGDPLRALSATGEPAVDESGREIAAEAEPPQADEPDLPEATAAGRAEATTRLEEALGRATEGALEDDGALGESESGAEGKPGEDSRTASATATLRDERRTRAGSQSEKKANESATGRGTDEKVSGGETDGPSESSDGSAGESSSREGNEQVALDQAAAARRARGSAGESPLQAGASAGQSQEAGEDGASSDPSESGTPGAGVGTAPQRGATPPLGEATDLEVTLEEVLLAAQRDEPPPERLSRPSRRAEEIAIAAPPSGRSAAPSSPDLERPALKVPYPLRDRALVRDYFEPRPDEGDDETGEPKSPHESPSATSADQENP